MSNFKEIRRNPSDFLVNKVRRNPSDFLVNKVRRTLKSSNPTRISLTFNSICNYDINEIIAEFLDIESTEKLGSWYFYEYYKPIIRLRIFHHNKFNYNTIYSEILCKLIPVKYLNKFKLGLSKIYIIPNNDKMNKHDLHSIKTIQCKLALHKNDIIQSYPKYVKSLIIDCYFNFIIDFTLFKNLKYLKELSFENKITIKNLCESTDSPNSKEFELPITKLKISDKNIEPDILKYFKSLTFLKIFDSFFNENFLQLIYFPKSLIYFKIWCGLYKLLQYPNTPFYNFVTNQVKELYIGCCTNEDLSKLKSLEILNISSFNSSVYKLPHNVYYLQLDLWLYDYEKKEIQEYIKLLFDNNPNLRIFEFKYFRDTFLSIKIKNGKFKINSREEMIRAINFEI
jgi:hypothetical protein